MEQLTLVEKILKLIGEYGYPLVLSVIFLILFIWIFKKQREDMQKLMNNTKKEHPDDEDVDVLEAINDKIYSELRGFLGQMSADRAYIFMYHNGGVSHSGLYFQRMSCICEVVGSGVMPLSKEFQNLHKAAYSNVCNSLRERGCWYIEDTEQLKSVDPFMYQTLLGRRVESTFVKALKDSRGSVIGFVGIDYCSLSHLPKIEDIRTTIKSVALRLSSLVDIRDDMKEKK